MFGAGSMGGGGWTKSDTWVQTLVPRMSLAGQVPFLGPHHLNLGKVEGVPPEMKFSQANEEHPKRVGDTQEDQGRPGWLILNTGRKVGQQWAQWLPAYGWHDDKSRLPKACANGMDRMHSGGLPSLG